jgi:hypothetical protein
MGNARHFAVFGAPQIPRTDHGASRLGHVAGGLQELRKTMPGFLVHDAISKAIGQSLPIKSSNAKFTITA